KIIKTNFATSDLFPFNPNKILKNILAFSIKLIVSSANEIKIESYRQNVKLQTLVTLVSIKFFILLQNLIIQRNVYTLNETSKQNLAKHLQKYIKAFQKSSDRIQFLTTINNETKVRRLTKSLVLEKAKVMSYENLEEARAKRVVKNATKAAKGKGKRGRKCKRATPEAEEATADKVKRGRKRKSTVLEAEAEAEEPEPEPNPKMARTSKAPALLRASVMETPIAEDEIVPEPWRAPVAKMW
ncbi:hypothetical protein BDZ45DRAFT_605460, partial [Acephala macrosclerotiorum]